MSSSCTEAFGKREKNPAKHFESQKSSQNKMIEDEPAVRDWSHGPLETFNFAIRAAAVRSGAARLAWVIDPHKLLWRQFNVHVLRLDRPTGASVARPLVTSRHLGIGPRRRQPRWVLRRMNCHLTYIIHFGVLHNRLLPDAQPKNGRPEIFQFLFYLPAGKCVDLVELVTNGETGVEAVKMSV